MERLALVRRASRPAAQQRQRQDVEKCGGEVSWRLSPRKVRTMAPTLRLRTRLRLRLKRTCDDCCSPTGGTHTAIQMEGFGTSLDSSMATLAQSGEDAEGVSRSSLLVDCNSHQPALLHRGADE